MYLLCICLTPLKSMELQSAYVYHSLSIYRWKHFTYWNSISLTYLLLLLAIIYSMPSLGENTGQPPTAINIYQRTCAFIVAPCFTQSSNLGLTYYCLYSGMQPSIQRNYVLNTLECDSFICWQIQVVYLKAVWRSCAKNLLRPKIGCFAIK